MHPHNETKGSENEPGTGKSGTTPAKAAKFAKAAEEGTETVAALATLAAVHPQNQNERSEPTPAKAAKPANPSPANARGITDEKSAAIVEYDIGAVRQWEGTPSEPALLAPGNWFDRFGPPGEPSFDQPCPSRRGLVESRGVVLLHFCVTCGAWGAFGYGVVDGRPGRWYCREHRPRSEP
jgi:hypothetical protein